MGIYKTKDLITPINTTGTTYVGNELDQVYTISSDLITSGGIITIIDKGGNNTIELAEGLTISSSILVANETKLTLSNGAIVNIRDADTFTFNIGGNSRENIAGVDKTFTQFATDVLGIDLPLINQSAVTVNDRITIASDGTTTKYEPNGTITLPYIITNGETVSFDSTSADNYYSFTLNSDGTILLNGSDIYSSSMSYKIYDSDLKLVKNSSVSSSTTESLSAGSYYFQAIDSSGGTFSITSSVMSGGTTIDDDHGNDKIDATLISIGNTVSGEIETLSDEDWFKIYLSADTDYSIKMDGNDINTNSIQLYNSSSALALESDYESYNEDYAEINYTVTQSGYYYLAASDLGDNSTGSYTINISETVVSNQPDPVTDFDTPHDNVDLNGLKIDWVNDSSEDPYDSIGYITATFDNIASNQFFAGSGVLISPKHVLTNAHVVLNEGELANGITFYSGLNGENTSTESGTSAVHLYAQSDTDTTGNYWPDNDLAIVTLNQEIGNIVGYHSLYSSSEDELNGENVFWAGYPQEDIEQDNSTTYWDDIYMWQAFGEVFDYSNSSSYNGSDGTSYYGGDGQIWLTESLAGTKGASGSPLFYDSGSDISIVGVYSGSLGDTPVAANIDDDSYQWIKDIVEADGYFIA